MSQTFGVKGVVVSATRTAPPPLLVALPAEAQSPDRRMRLDHVLYERCP